MLKKLFLVLTAMHLMASSAQASTNAFVFQIVDSNGVAQIASVYSPSSGVVHATSGTDGKVNGAFVNGATVTIGRDPKISTSCSSQNMPAETTLTLPDWQFSETPIDLGRVVIPALTLPMYQPGMDRDEQWILSQIALLRASEGAPPVSALQTLDASADGYVQYLEDKQLFDHCLWSSPFSRARAAGFEGSQAGEVLTKADNAVDAWSGWMSSPVHRDALKSSQVTYVGIARKNRTWAVLLGIGPCINCQQPNLVALPDKLPEAPQKPEDKLIKPSYRIKQTLAAKSVKFTIQTQGLQSGTATVVIGDKAKTYAIKGKKTILVQRRSRIDVLKVRIKLVFVDKTTAVKKYSVPRQRKHKKNTPRP